MYLNNNALGADSPTKLNSNATGQVHRRKYVDESKLRKVSFILFISVCDMSWIGISYLKQYIYGDTQFENFRVGTSVYNILSYNLGA